MSDTHSKFIDDIVDIFTENEKLIKYNYNGKTNQTLIDKRVVQEVIAYIRSNKQNVDLKEVLKFVVRESFELSEDDIIISKNGHIFIKEVDKIKKVEVAPEEKDTIANRYSGFSEEEMKSFYSEVFSDIDKKEFFSLVARDFIDTYIIAKHISNEAYEKNVISYLHNLTLNHLVKLYDNSDGFFKGFSGYVFRKHFKEVFKYVADIMLDEISIGNDYMIEFLKYYASNIIVVGGEKYKVPTIEAKDGMQWTVVSMLSIAKLYTKAKKSSLVLQQKIAELGEQISVLYINGLSPVEYHTIFLKNKKALEEKIVNTNKKLDKYTDALAVTESAKRKIDLRAEIKQIEDVIKKLRQDKSDLMDKMIRQSILQKYKELQSERDSLKRMLSNEQKIISQNKETYTSIRTSLVKALMSKKKLVS